MPVSKRKGDFPNCGAEAKHLSQRPRHSGLGSSLGRDGDVRKAANVGGCDVRIPTMCSNADPLGSSATAFWRIPGGYREIDQSAQVPAAAAAAGSEL
ncbi:hypothetical protein Trco_005550 [Trichoderma cornu-damae]|uniref:Uncharacterized protein n=1 Tax=Trichoderma cornu-damae TaxID=654480 RepID=A0A9P8TVU8_9HYPO|nr:hypothetical protein Trco_005550 [Trichoderma cornu-damae]